MAPKTYLADFVFAHGAGAGSHSDFMQTMADELEHRGIRVLRFDFSYMQQILLTGKRRPPDKMPQLLQSFEQILEQNSLGDRPVFIGGKSMGGRVATLLAADATKTERHAIAGVICFGYPFHPPGKPEKLRIDHLPQLTAPCLILQGERDAFGKREEVIHYSLGSQVSLSWLTDGDHSLKPRKASGHTLVDNLQQAANEVQQFVRATVQNFHF